MNKMKKMFGLSVMVSLLLVMSACGAPKSLPSAEVSVQEEAKEPGDTALILPEGKTLETRFAAPKGYTRIPAGENSLATFLREYGLKEADAPLLLYDGTKKPRQDVHAAIFTLPVTERDLQQCADSVIRVWAEYYYQTGQYEKIRFHFTNGFLCDYSKWIQGYRVQVNGNEVSWEKRGAYDDSYGTFENYLNTVFCYAGTLSLDTYDTVSVDLEDMDAGDMLLKGGSPGHVVMVVDVCENDQGKKAFLLGQGYMPAQEFHVVKNPAHEEDPWYYEEEMTFPVKTAEYTFDDPGMIKRLNH